MSKSIITQVIRCLSLSIKAKISMLSISVDWQEHCALLRQHFLHENKLIMIYEIINSIFSIYIASNLQFIFLFLGEKKMCWKCSLFSSVLKSNRISKIYQNFIKCYISNDILSIICLKLLISWICNTTLQSGKNRTNFCIIPVIRIIIYY